MRQMPVSGLVPGVMIELTGGQKLWDVTKTPWREFVPPARLTVIQVSRMASGAGGARTPYSLILLADDGARIDLEVADGDELVTIASV